MKQDVINITLHRELWDALNQLALRESANRGQRVATIRLLRTAIKVFLLMKPEEVNAVLRRLEANTRSTG
jgi:hypothetical protein